MSRPVSDRKTNSGGVRRGELSRTEKIERNKAGAAIGAAVKSPAAYYEEVKADPKLLGDLETVILQGAIACKGFPEIIEDVEDAFGITLNNAQIKRHLKKGVQSGRTSDTLEEARQLEVARLDDLYGKLHETIGVFPDPKTVTTMLRISERRAALMGLDAPIQIEVKQQVTEEIKLFMNIMRTGLDSTTFQSVMKAVRAYKNTAGLSGIARAEESEEEVITVELKEDIPGD